MSKVFVKYSLFLFLLVAQFRAVGQVLNQVIDYADELFETGEYYGSIHLYEKAMEMDSANAEILYKYGRNLASINQSKKASRYLYKAYLIDRGKSIESLPYELAEAYRNSGEYRKSSRYYTKALIPYRKDRKGEWYQRINQRKKSASWANKNQKELQGIEVKNIGSQFNTPSSEFGPSIYQDHLFYTALVADSVLEGQKIGDKDYYSRLFYQKLNTKEKSKQILVEKEEQIKGKHLANFHLLENNTAYFSVCDSGYQCEIWSGEYKDGVLSKIKALNSNINASGSTNTQGFPVIIDQQEYLYFVSDRARGFGGLDLWVAKKESYGFDQAVNLGAGVNSPDNEISPVYNPKNATLYFSSDWHIGYGGFDMYTAKGGPESFEDLENLNLPYNSSFDEYYFFPKNDQAVFSSNRKKGNIDAKGTCCNDLFLADFIEDPYLEKDPEKIEVSVEVLNAYLPLNLYFHNDEPNPKSRDTLSTVNYLTSYKQYVQLKGEYQKQFTKLLPDSIQDEGEFEIDEFFEEEVVEGVEKLEFFTPLLLKELEKGSQIELSIKGYASALSASDYNLNLTLRRISSLINYFREYENGALLPYLTKTSENKGSLKINKMPFGEFAVEGNDFEGNKAMAIYSPIAAKQRKIELMAITKTEEGVQSFDGAELTAQAKLNISQTSKMLKWKDLEANNEQEIKLSNTGDALLKIYAINSNCDCVELNYQKEIQAGASENLTLKINTENQTKRMNLVLTVFSNTQPNISEINLIIE